ncbi:MAG TPA: PEGA domain-containing protein, partial [Vicinamibacterales bacterium]
LTIRAGTQTAQYIELQNVALTGGLDIRSDPAGARVVIDGQVRGTTPVTVRDLPPGDHQIVLEARGRKVTQTVRIDAGITAQLVVPLPRR